MREGTKERRGGVIKNVDSLDVPSGSDGAMIGGGGRRGRRRKDGEGREGREKEGKYYRGQTSGSEGGKERKENESCGWKGGRSHTCSLGVVSLIRPPKSSIHCLLRMQRRL